MTAGRTINSQRQDWGTPQKYVDAIQEFFDGAVDLDPCSNSYSIVNAQVEYTLPETNGLTASWNFPRIYVNPPYGADKQNATTIKDWLRRCAHAHKQHGSEVLALVPVATNTAHWKKYVFGKARAVAFLYDTRLKFLVNGQNGGKGAPMSCAMVYWGKQYERFFQVFTPYGAVVDLTSLMNVEMGNQKQQPMLTLLQDVS